jgi:hypothetical protein
MKLFNTKYKIYNKNVLIAEIIITTCETNVFSIHEIR